MALISQQRHDEFSNPISNVGVNPSSVIICALVLFEGVFLLSSFSFHGAFITQILKMDSFGIRMTMTIFGIIIIALVSRRLFNFTSCVLLYGGGRNVTAIEGKIINTSSFECLFTIYVIDLLSLTIALLLVKNSFKTVCQ